MIKQERRTRRGKLTEAASGIGWSTSLAFLTKPRALLTTIAACRLYITVHIRLLQNIVVLTAVLYYGLRGAFLDITWFERLGRNIWEQI